MTLDKNCLRVLFVDDEMNLLAGLARNIVRLRPLWKTYYSSNPDDAVSVIQTCGDKIDVVVADIEMPEMDGLSVLHILQIDYPDIVRITLSGKLDSFSILGSNRLSHKHLCKPIDVGVLCSIIQETHRNVVSHRDEKID